MRWNSHVTVFGIILCLIINVFLLIYQVNNFVLILEWINNLIIYF